jgi:hypothetical protein
VGPSVHGEFQQYVTFELEEPAPSDGYIIQRITARVEATWVKGREPDFDSITYYEAWEVRAGETTPVDYNRVNGSVYNDIWDLSWVDPFRWRNGNWGVEGVVRFYIGELPDHFAVGNVEEAGDLPSSERRPGYWTDFGTGRFFCMYWDHNEVHSKFTMWEPE